MGDFALWQLGVGGAGVIIGLREAFKFARDWKATSETPTNGKIGNGQVKADLAEHGVKLDAILQEEQGQTTLLHNMDKNIAIMANKSCPLK